MPIVAAHSRSLRMFAVEGPLICGSETSCYRRLVAPGRMLAPPSEQVCVYRLLESPGVPRMTPKRVHSRERILAPAYYMVPCPRSPYIPNGISISSVVFALLMTWPTDRNANRPRYSGNNKPHLTLRTATGPATWNALSDHIRTVADPIKFRKLLKSHCFSQAFNIC